MLLPLSAIDHLAYVINNTMHYNTLKKFSPQKFYANQHIYENFVMCLCSEVNL